MSTNDIRRIHEVLKMRHELLKASREFFYERNYIEVESANLMATVPPDPHIDPLEVNVSGKGPFFLHTSPEMGLKKLLRSGHKRIFQICKVWRVEDHQEVHNTEFTMLEWYREGSCRDIMAETVHLIEYIAQRLPVTEKEKFTAPFTIYELDRLFHDIVGFDPFPLDRNTLFAALKDKGFLGIDDKDDWNSLFFKAFIQEIEQKLHNGRPYVIYGWPSFISTMAKKRDDRTNMVERFELYIDGLEIANGYAELTDPEEQRERFEEDNRERGRLGKRQFPLDAAFLESIGMIEHACAGVSIGIDRLLMALFGRKTIDEVIVDRLII
ncbi:MAG: lysyl-tRNA synthetase-like protein GenX [Deltaproteobacteria bacterium]|nr:lysyl-tRNA synthetase-like protein GenX [Deltaproteobacteria bacterium]